MTRSFAVLLLSAAAVQPLAAADAPRPRVAVMEFKNKASNYSWGWYQAGKNAQDMLVTELVKSGKYRVIEREQLQAIMQEKHLSLSGDVDPKTAIQIGKMLGVEYLVTGSVTELGTTNRGASVPSGFGLPSVSVRSQKMDAALDARAFSTSTGEIAWADSARESTSDSSVFVAGAGGGANDQGKIDKLMRPVVVKLASSMAKANLASTGLGGHGDASGVAGKIAKVDGGTVYVNVGSEAGIKPGDEFNVFRIGDTIKDPDTGEVLGTNETRVGRIRIDAVRGPRLSTATAVSGSAFKPGDALKP